MENLEVWRVGRLEGWKHGEFGGLEGWKVGSMENLEVWRVGRLEGWKHREFGGLEGWKVGSMENLEVWRVGQGCGSYPCSLCLLTSQRTQQSDPVFRRNWPIPKDCFVCQESGLHSRLHLPPT